MTVILVAFASCSSKKTQISMKPETTTISGDLSECFEIVDQECIVKLDKKGGIEPFATWSVKLRRTDKPFPFADDIDAKYLSSTFINPKDVKISNDLRQVVAKADYVIVVTPSAFLQRTLEPLHKSRLNKKKIITAVKGIIPETLQFITEYLHTEFAIPMSNIAMISGPSHAEEIAQEKFTFLTAASENQELAADVAKMFTNRYVRASVSKDIKGAELAVIMKNIYALGAGIYSGLGYGDNFIAAYIAARVRPLPPRHAVGGDLQQPVGNERAPRLCGAAVATAGKLVGGERVPQQVRLPLPDG